MMKKNVSKYFLMATMLVGVGCISSCKDYNDEIVAEYRGEDAKLQDQIDALKTKHQEDLDAAKAERDRIQKELDDHIAEAEAKYATKDELAAAKADLESKYAAGDAALQSQIDAINTQLSSLDAEIDQVKSDLEAKIDALAKCNCDVAKLEKLVSDLEALSTKVTTLENDLKNAATKDDLNNYATTAQLQALQDIVNGLVSCNCGDLLSKITNLEGKFDSYATLTDLANLKSQVETDSARIDALQQTIAQIKECTKCDSLATALSALEAKHADDIAAIEENMASLYERILLAEDLAKQYTDDAIAALKDYVIPEIEGLKGLLNAVRLDVEALKPLQDEVAALKVAVAVNTAAIEGLTQKVDNLEEAIEQRISSVNIQGAYSPVIGYFNIPMGIKSNVVAAYKGEFATGVTEMNFPFAYSESMYDGNVNPLQALKASLGYDGEDIAALEDGKAGKIYLTINPTEVNLDSVEFALVNSLGENAPVKLAVQPSEDKLTFGYTRAGGAALYEAVATIEDTEATDFDLNISDYKEIFRDLKNGGDINLSLIAEALYGTFNEIADANAVSASWTDAMGHSHTVLSNYDIAALSVNPLSFAFMQGVEFESVPGIGKISQIIDNVIDKVDVDIHIGDFKDVQFNVEHLDLDENKFIISVDTTLTVDGQQVTLYKKGEVSGFFVEVEGVEYPLEVRNDVVVDVEGQSIRFTYTNTDFVSEILKIEDMVNSELSEIEGLIDQVNDMLGELRETDQKLHQSVDDAKDKVKAELNKYLDKVNDKLCAVLNSVNSKLQPVLLAHNGDDFAMLSQAESRPVVVSADEVTLVPTTYTGELLAPAFKKYVAVTAVNGSTDNLAAANAAVSADFNKVLDGDVREITFKGEAGNTYEITYSALDYAGIVVNTKYYVTVK